MITGINSVRELIERNIGDAAAKHFKFELNYSIGEMDTFEIQSVGDNILIRGSGVNALAAGFNWYLKHFCKAHFSWCGNQTVIPAPLPQLSVPVKVSSPYRFRYYLNYCTFSYSMAFWDWERWEKEIDWMAMNGINIALCILGFEEVWKRVMLWLGYSYDACRDIICGPSYFPWQWMQNMASWGGPLPDWWYDERVELARKVHRRMLDLGISPVLQGYSGMIPVDFNEKYPQADVIDQGLWCGFQRPALLNPLDKMFGRIASKFYEEQRLLFGDDIHYYCTDMFHEGGNIQGIDVAKCTQAVQDKMLEEDNKAVWILQAWGDNPSVEIMHTLKKENTIILDLFCESDPQWKKKNAFNGIPWLWCIINNFGGKQGLFGNLRQIANEPVNLIRNPEAGTMTGIGLLMEGIENNPVVFDLITEMMWETSAPDLYEWLKQYTERRYGKFSLKAWEAWKLLADSIYNCTTEGIQGSMESIICARPRDNIDSVSTWGPKEYYYDKIIVLKACKMLFESYDELSSSDAYVYDIVDITRQVAADLAWEYYKKFIQAYKGKDISAFKYYSEKFLNLIRSQDNLLGTRKEFLLGKWLSDARAMAKHEEEKNLFEFNARSLITIWGPRKSSESLHDYSHRQWAGLTSDFYLKRWQNYLKLLEDTIEKRSEIKAYDWFEWEYEWTCKTGGYSCEEQGNAYEIVGNILKDIEKSIL